MSSPEWRLMSFSSAYDTQQLLHLYPLDGVRDKTLAEQDYKFQVLQVYVILFGVGKSETEGIYSLRAVTGSDGLPVDTIIAFESGEDAQR